MNYPRILITGAQGFVGRHLCRELLGRGHFVRAACRQVSGADETNGTNLRLVALSTGDLTQFSNWKVITAGVDCIIHLAARTHHTDESGQDALPAYLAANVDVTRSLAEAAVATGVSRFIYLSSIKAVANNSDEPLCEHAPCHPADSYGITKLEAERQLKSTLFGSNCSYTILRPPLVYGEGVKGNFLRLMQLVQRGFPLPRIQNKRSMVHVDNLVDAIVAALTHTAAANEVFHIADGQPVSTTELIRAMNWGFDRSARIIPFPQNWVTRIGTALGRENEVQRLAGSLTVSTEKLESLLQWRSKVSTLDGIASTCRAFANAPWSTPTPALEYNTSQKRAA